MKRKLLHLVGKSYSFVPTLTLSFIFTLLFATQSTAQVINEGFEETVWTTLASTSTAGSITVTSYSTTGAGSTYATGSWRYSSAYVVSHNAASLGSWRTHSGVRAMHLGGSGASYIATPIISDGVVSVTLWMSASNSGTGLALYANTGTAVTSNTGSMTSTAGAVGNTNAAGWTMLASFTNASTNGYVSYSYSVSNAASTNPVILKFQRSGSGEPTIDDIVITSPTLAAPTVQATNINFSAVSSTDITATWTNGDGANRVVFVKEGAQGTITAPVDGTTYTASNNWNSGSPTGTQLGTSGYYCVYNGTGNSIALNTLNPSSTYWFYVFENNGTGASSKYLTTAGTNNPLSQATSAPPAVIYYRSKQTGNWADAGSWESSTDNAIWVDALAAPDNSSSTITILNGHTITVNAGTVTTDQTFVNTGGTLAVSTGATLSIANGAGTDLTVNGSIDFSGNFTSVSGATTSVTGTFENKVNNVAFSAGIGSMTIAAGGTYKVNGYNGNAELTFTNVNFTNGIGAAGSNLYIALGAPRLPVATIGNVIWNTPTSGNSFLNSGSNTISGDFTILGTIGINHGSGGTGRTLTVGGSLYMQGGVYHVAGAGANASNTLNVNGDIIISGGTLYASSSITAGGFGIINAKGNVNHTSGTFGVAAAVTGGSITFNAATTQSFSTIGLTNAVNITVGSAASPTVTLATDLALNAGAKLLVTAGTMNFNDKLVTLKSDATGTASIAAVTGTLSGATNVTIQRYIAGGLRAYRFLGHPFNAAMPLTQLTDDIDITGNGNDAATPPFAATGSNAASAFSYNPTITNAGTVTAIGSGGGAASDPGWVPYTTAAGTVGIGNGFRVLVRGSKGQAGSLTGGVYTPDPVTLSATGALNATGNFAKTITYSSGNPSYNLIGNPYPSNINLKTVTPGAGANNNFWIFNPHQGTKGGYITYAFGTNDYSLPSFTGFLVQAIAGAGNTITFHEADKTATDTSTMLRAINGARSIVEMSITSGNIFWDRFMLQLDKKGTASYDAKWDADKFANGEVSFYSLTNDRKALAVDVRPFEMDKVIPMGFVSNAARNYTLTVNSYELDNSVSLYLRDKYLATETKVEEGMSYQFGTNADAASQGDNRFELVQKSAPVLVPLATSFTVKLSPNPARDIVKVSFSNQEQANTTIAITNAEGKTVKTVNAGKVQTGETSINVKGLTKGNYYVTLNNGMEKKTEKLVIQ